LAAPSRRSKHAHARRCLGSPFHLARLVRGGEAEAGVARAAHGQAIGGRLGLLRAVPRCLAGLPRALGHPDDASGVDIVFLGTPSSRARGRRKGGVGRAIRIAADGQLRPRWRQDGPEANERAKLSCYATPMVEASYSAAGAPRAMPARPLIPPHERPVASSDGQGTRNAATHGTQPRQSETSRAPAKAGNERGLGRRRREVVS
jgi:hypothetical protein